jgi:hypothetical protein
MAEEAALAAKKLGRARRFPTAPLVEWFGVLGNAFAQMTIRYLIPNQQCHPGACGTMARKRHS